MNMAEYAISWQSWVGAAEKCPFWTHYKRTLKWYFWLGPSVNPFHIYKVQLQKKRNLEGAVRRLMANVFNCCPFFMPGMGFFFSFFFTFSAKENVIDLSCVMIYHNQVHFSLTLPNWSKRLKDCKTILPRSVELWYLRVQRDTSCQYLVGSV